jgi:3-dehydroquinate dehydratase type II
MRNVFVVHGPNLNLLGTREPEIYGSTTLPELENEVAAEAVALGLHCTFFQSNHEGAIVDALQGAAESADAVVINAGALTHYSYTIYDALVAIDKPTVEVHISNIHAREAWRRQSVISPAADHVIYGRGSRGYADALRRLVATAAVAPRRISYGTAESQYGELRVPPGAGPHPVAVLIHGGFWRDVWTLDLMDSLAVDLHGRGFATWNIEYHRVGSGGGWPLTMEDVAAAIDHLSNLAPDHDLDLTDVTAIGHSAGGHLALWSAARPEQYPEQPDAEPDVIPQRVVALAPVTDLAAAYELDLGEGAAEEFLRRSPEDGPERYAVASPVALLPLGARQLVVHGDADAKVPIDLSQRYVATAAAAGDDVTFQSLEGTDHFDVIDPASPAWSGVVEWLGY